MISSELRRGQADDRRQETPRKSTTPVVPIQWWIAVQILAHPGLPGLLAAENPPPVSHTFSSLLDPVNACDLIVVTHPDLAAEASRLVDHHSASGLRVCLVETADIAGEFGGGTLTDQAIRSFVEHAATSYSIAPTYLLLLGDANISSPAGNLIPTHVETSSYSYGGNNLYAADPWYVRALPAGGVKPLMHLGRLPARTAGELRNYVDKVLAYEALGTPPWAQRTLMLIGDKNINTNNEDMRAYGDRLWTDFFSAGGGNQVYHASSFTGGAWEEQATATTRSAWNSGYGMVQGFGNITHEESLVMMAHFHLRTPPTFTQTLAPSGYLPLVVGGTCLVNYFYTSNPGGSIGEDLLFKASNRGAIATISPTHVALVFENYQWNRLLLESILELGIRDVGQAVTRARVVYTQLGLGRPFVEQQLHLLGDPALRLAIASPPPESWRSGFEVEDPMALQDVVLARSTGIIGESSRVLYPGQGNIPAPVGERLLHVQAADLSATQGDFIEWKIADVNRAITRHTVLSFRLRVEDSAYGPARVCVDGSTTAGPLRDQIQVVDQLGQTLKAGDRPPPSPGWHRFYADLGCLAYHTLQSITVRYEAPGASFGLADACVDDVRVGPPGEEDDQVLNGGFEEDCDRDGRPDFWEPIAGVPGTAILVRNDFYHAEGDYSLLLAGGSCTPQGAEQLIHLDPDRSDYMVGLMAVSPARPQTLTVRLVDAGTNAVLQNVTAPIGSAWTPLSIELTAPGSGCGGPPPRIALEVIPELCGPNLYLDAVQVVPRQAIAIDPPGPSPALSRPVAFRLASHPLPAGSRAGLSADLARSGHLAVRMVDARGRLLPPVLDAWRHAGSSPVPLPGNLPAGVYFLEARLDGRLEAREKIVLVP